MKNVLPIIAVLLTASPVLAHHSNAAFDGDKVVGLKGTVTQWNYNNPHSWLMIDALDASNDGMRVWTLLCTIVELLYDDDLLASLAALKDDCNLDFALLIAWPERDKNEHFSGLVDLKKA